MHNVCYNKTHSTNCDYGDASDGPKGQKVFSAATGAPKTDVTQKHSPEAAK